MKNLYAGFAAYEMVHLYMPSSGKYTCGYWSMDKNKYS